MHTIRNGLLIIIAIVSSYSGFSQATEAWYIRRTAPEPWTWCPVLNTNITEMDNVFGVGGWNSGYFTSVDPAVAFGPTSKFVFLEGGDDHAIELKNFLITNITTIENWVYNGGSLFLNAAPNEGGDINFGFDGTTLDFTPGVYMSNAVAAIVTHPIFLGPYTPAGTSWTGTSFTHAKVTGTCLTTLVKDAFSTNIAAAEKHWGAGCVIFGSMTVTGWHSPFTNARNMRQNIFVYLYDFVGVIAGDFSYPDSIYCQDEPNPFPIIDPGADTGIYTATPTGLIIDDVTGEIDLSLSTPGTYVITNGAVIDCVPSSFTLIVGDDPVANFSYLGAPYCVNEPDKSPLFPGGGTPGAFTSSPPGLSLNPATGTIFVSASAPGTYTITNTVTSLYCGVATHDVTVVILPTYDIVFNADICNDITYTLPDGTIVAATGTYINNFLTAAGCDSIITTNLVVHSASSTTINAAICSGDTYILPDGTATGISGTYTLNFPTPYGCDSIITTILDVNDIYAYTVNESICSGETFTLPDGTIVSVTGSYVSNLITAAGCDSIITTHLMVFPAYAVPVAASICSGDIYTLPDGTTTGAAGIYVTILPTIHDCDSVITTTITVDPVYLPVINAQICEGESYTLPGGITTTVSGTYLSNFITVNGCDSIITTNLIVNPLPVINFPIDDIVCLEDIPFTLYASPSGGIYTGNGISGSTFDPLAAGVGGPYQIDYTYTDANGCTSSSSVFISVDQNFADAWGDTTVYAGEQAVLYSEAGGDYLWTPPTQIICDYCSTTNAYPLESITYTINSINENGCIASDNMFVTVLPNPGNGVFIPNTFTPNGDNINDYFFAYGYNLSMIKSMMIFDRWGELIFYKENMPEGSESEGWDGTMAGKELNEGVYAFVTELTFNNGVTTVFKGNITLIK